MLELLQVLRSSRQQFDNCSIPNARQYTAYFNMIYIVLDTPILVLSSLMFLLIHPRKLFLFLPHFVLDFNPSSYNSFIFRGAEVTAAILFKGKDKEALFNVAYNVTDNISSRAILRHNNYIFNRYLPVFISLAQPLLSERQQGSC